MALVDQKTRSITVQTLHILEKGQDPHQFDWQTGGYLSIEAYEGFNAWHGRLQRKQYRADWPYDGVQRDLSRFDDLVKLLQPIPRDRIYPEFPADELTLFRPQQGADSEALYLKAPKLGHYQDGSDDLAVRLLSEARVHERILRNPHPNLDSYLGCVVEEGRLVRLALKRYGESVHDRSQSATPRGFTFQQRMGCMDQVEAAAAHLHSLGLAHNDISPSNIMFDNTGRAVLIDFDSCAPLGNTLTKGGLVSGWKGPIAGEGPQFHRSSATCDELAIQEIRRHLAEGSDLSVEEAAAANGSRCNRDVTAPEDITKRGTSSAEA
ncbi:Maternal embryonic leucine zipper kinase [Colletotrichum shisoi]|uniref:Maternal embryonic leucine zipper kinase n=1 Tax=Colletotrichum shisoi TaxID=2078593 RepID=A0A5Q4C2C6_9PEZI|nr:Maternal embryonic leucine zipper kinase [Colletotrichum shisoi]